MAKKEYTAEVLGSDTFFTAVPTGELYPPQAQDTETPVDGRSARKGAPSFMFSLRLPIAWRSRLSDEAWKRRTTVTGLINTIIREWLERQEQEG